MSGAIAMPDFTEQELLQIIATGEADRVEFKESLAGDAATRIREAICAFANDLPGREKPGLVFIGVKDDGTIGDLAVTDRLLQQLADMKTDGNIVPPPSLTVENRRLQGKEIAHGSIAPDYPQRSDAQDVRGDQRARSCLLVQ